MSEKLYFATFFFNNYLNVWTYLFWLKLRRSIKNVVTNKNWSRSKVNFWPKSNMPNKTYRAPLNLDVLSNDKNWELQEFVSTDNPMQNKFLKIKKSSKVGQNWKTLISASACFFSITPKIYLCGRVWALGCVPMQVWDFPNVSLFPKILCLSSSATREVTHR